MEICLRQKKERAHTLNPFLINSYVAISTLTDIIPQSDKYDCW